MSAERKPHSGRWFWEYGWLGPGIASDGADDPLFFAAAEELGYEFVYGGAVQDRGEWDGYPAEFERATTRIKELEEQLEALQEQYRVLDLSFHHAEEFIEHMDMSYRWAEWCEGRNPASTPDAPKGGTGA